MRGASAPAGGSADPVLRPGLAGLRERECIKLLGRLRRLGVTTTTRRYEAGEDVFLAGEPADGLYVLSEGLLKLSKRYSGFKEVTLRLIGPWEVFGDLAPGLSLTQGVRAHAFTDCEATKVPKVFVERAVRTDREAAAVLLALLGLELAYGREIVGCLLPPATNARLAVLLPMLAERFGRAAADGAISLPPLTHSDLAGMIATSRESVTAAMQSLRRQGLVKKEGRTVTILKPDGLAEVASRQARATAAPSSVLQARLGGGVEHSDDPGDLP